MPGRSVPFCRSTWYSSELSRCFQTCRGQQQDRLAGSAAGARKEAGRCRHRHRHCSHRSQFSPHHQPISHLLRRGLIQCGLSRHCAHGKRGCSTGCRRCALEDEAGRHPCGVEGEHADRNAVERGWSDTHGPDGRNPAGGRRGATAASVSWGFAVSRCPPKRRSRTTTACLT